jgi:D-Tyr-tRNAtyr deacylase
MAEVQRPIIPIRLFRYRSLTRSEDAVHQEIDSILGKYLYCSQFTNMNDPMEGFF